MLPASAPSPSGAWRTPCWARRWGENVRWGMKAWSGNRSRGDLPMTISMITLFEIASQRSTSQAYWVMLALISNIANYLKYNYFLDCDGIDDVTFTLRLWRFSDFCSRQTVGVAGDDIMFHILVSHMNGSNIVHVYAILFHMYMMW